MKRRLLLLAGLTGAGLLLASSARAQGPVVFYLGLPGDTAVGAVPGAEADIPVRETNPWWSYAYYYNSVASATVTFVFDTAKVQLLGVEPVGSGLSTITGAVAGAGTLTVSASGYAYGADAEVYALRVKLKAGVTDGSYLWIKSDSAALCYYSYCASYGTYYRPAVSAIAQMCHATHAWGDVDGDGVVDSRDALITLSAAVGLPNTGDFDLAIGDVDGDGLTNSRDALIMLSYAIGIPTAGRVGIGISDACPGLTAPGDTLAFFRNDLPGLEALGASSTSPAAIGGATSVAAQDGGGSRLASDGRTIVYMCPGHGGQQICRVDADTGGVVMLTFDSLLTDGSPDWSPSGDSIVYLRNGQIWKMAANGSGQAFVPGTGNGINGVQDVKWGRDSTKIAYANGQLHVMNGDGTGDAVVTTTGITSGIQGLIWSPTGDSLAFGYGNWGMVVPVAGGTPSVAFGFAGGLGGVDWSSQGVVVGINPGYGSPPGIWLMRGAGGPIFRVTKPTTYDAGPTLRRNP